MLEVGQIFRKNDQIYCVIDVLDFNMKKYVLFSVESDGEEENELDYSFYEIVKNNSNFELSLVMDENINYELFKIVEGEKND